MRPALFLTLAALAALAFLSVPAFAGDVTVAGGQVTWKSTKCVAPVEPPSLIAADRMTGANDMNVLVSQYNDYAQKMQTYMGCMSDEANADANLVSQAIISSAQASIDATQKSVDALGAEVKKQQ